MRSRMTESGKRSEFELPSLPEPPPFVPPSWLWLPLAINSIGEHMFPDNWSLTDRDARNLPELVEHRTQRRDMLLKAGLVRRTYDGRETAYNFGIGAEEKYMAEREAASRYESAMTETLSLLHSGRLNDHVMTDTGDLSPIPTSAWRSSRVFEALRLGRIQFVSEQRPFLVQGVVLVDAHRLEACLGIAKEQPEEIPSPAPPTPMHHAVPTSSADEQTSGRKPGGRTSDTEILSMFEVMCAEGKVSFEHGGKRDAARAIHERYPNYSLKHVERLITGLYSQHKTEG